MNTVFKNVLRQSYRIFLVVLAAIISALNIKMFVQSGNLFPGGFTGLTILLQHISQKYFSVHIPYSPCIILMNAIPLIISFRTIGKHFALYSCIMIIIGSVLVDIIPDIAITQDVLLAAVFGGIISAFSAYLCLRAGASGGGTDLLAILISEKYARDSWRQIFISNAIILCTAGFLFGWDRALYSLVFQYVAMQLITALYKRYQKVTLYIITNNAEELYHIISDTTNHDATLFKGVGCYSGEMRDLLYSVVSGEDLPSVIKKIREKDSAAFINVVRSEQLLGRFYIHPND